jgi:GT2 family glycosyltransferase
MQPGPNPGDAGTGRLAVIVPSYRRPQLLVRCLDALSRQTAVPEEILVVRRVDDVATASLLERWPEIRSIEVNGPGVVTAMHVGASATPAEFVVFTDDDAAPRPDWLETLRGHFTDPSVGAVGGRDIVDHPTQVGSLTARVGRVSRSGRISGNHHLGQGPPRDVDVLKGVNMAFRRTALTFPFGLRGTGAQVDFELACCLAASAAGWRLVYDPAALVDHAVGPRFGADQRGRPGATAVGDAAYNRLAIILSLRPTLGVQRAIFGTLIGERQTPGLLRFAIAILRGESDVTQRLLPSLSGQLAALTDVAAGRRIRMLACHYPAGSKADA